MNTKNKFLLLLSLLFIMSILAGCLDVEEEIAINQNGSGKYKLAIIVDQSLEDYLSDSESSFDFNEEQFDDLQTYSFYNENGYAVREIVINFNNLEEFIEEFNQSSSSDSVISLNYQTLSSGRMRFTHSINFENLENQSADDLATDLGNFVTSSILSGSEWRISISAPFIEETNGRLDEAGAVASWEIEFSDVVSNGTEHNAYVVYYPNKYLWPILGIAGCLCFAGLIVFGLFGLVLWRWLRRPKIQTLQVIEVRDKQNLLE